MKKPTAHEDHPVAGAYRPTGRQRPENDKYSPDDIRSHIPHPTYRPEVHQSHMSTLLTCPRLYLYKIRMGLARKHGIVKPLTLGTFFHAAMEGFYGEGTMQSAVHKVTQECEEMKEHIQEEYEHAGGNAVVVQRQMEEADSLADMGLLLAEIMYDMYPLKKNWIVVGIEVPCHAFVNEIGWSGGGRMDMLIYDKVLKGLFIVDHKSMGKKADLNQYKGHLAYDFQNRWYRRLATEVLSQMDPIPIPGTNLTTRDVPIKGFILNAVRKFTILHKKDQELEDFQDEVRGWYYGDKSTETRELKSGPRKGEHVPLWDHTKNRNEWLKNPPMRRFVVRFNEPVMPKELEVVSGMTAKAARCLPVLDNFPRWGELTGACLNQYNRACDFAPLCNSDRKNWAEIVAREYKVRPLSNHEKEGTSQPTQRQE